MRIIWPAATLSILVAIALAWIKTNQYPDPMEAVSLAVATEPLDGLAMVSLEKGYFAEAGLTVKSLLTASGKEALQALREDRVDFAFVAETPIVFDAFESPDLKIIAQVGRNHDEPRLVARRDLGIQSVEDLRGRRIGTQEKSSVHFFMYLALLKHRLTPNDVEVVYMKANALPEALANGEIDAFSMREPQVGQALQLLGDKVVVFTEPGLYIKTFSLVAKAATLRTRPFLVDKVLKGLLSAEDFARQQPPAAKNAITRLGGIDETTLTQLWPSFNFTVELDQVLLMGLQEESRWAIEAGMTDRTDVPDFLSMIDTDALMRVKPDAVHVFH